MNTREIIVVVQLRLDANHRDEFLRTLYDIVERSRIAPECLSYELFSRAEDENTLVLFQMWSTREAFEQNWLYTDLPPSRGDLVGCRLSLASFHRFRLRARLGPPLPTKVSPLTDPTVRISRSGFLKQYSPFSKSA